MIAQHEPTGKMVDGKWRIAPIYRTWDGMKRRCYKLPQGHRNYEQYQGRNIQVCEEWLDFQSFAAFARATGWRKGLSMHRLNNLGNYEPSNVVFLTKSAHSRLSPTTLRKALAVRANGKTCSKQTRCVETGEVFESAKAASRSIGYHQNSVTTAIRVGCRCGGFRWEHV